MPLYNWFKIYETGSLHWLLKDTAIVGYYLESTIQGIHDTLTNSYIKRFGLSESVKDIMRKERERALLQIKMIITGDRSLQPIINLCDRELELLKSLSNENNNFYESKVNLERIIGYQIDVKKTTVTEYYSLIKSVESSKNGRRTAEA